MPEAAPEATDLNPQFMAELAEDEGPHTWWVASTDPEERAKLRERNLHIFKHKYPPTYKVLESYVPKAELVFGDDGQPDMRFNDMLFYDGDINGFTEKQLDAFEKNPNRLWVNRPQPNNLDEHTGWFIDDMITSLTKEGEIELSVGRSEKTSFYALIMGIGLGPHLPEVIDRTQCRNMFLLEPNWEGIYHSLELLDWGKILMEFQKRDGDIYFYIDGTPQTWMDALRLQIRRVNAISIDGLNVFTHYRNSEFDEFTKKFNVESQLLMSGMGFFFDEQIMLQNSVDNLRHGGARTYVRSFDGFAKIPAVIVGCGPSLDDNIEDIKRLEDKAVIISCGSALGPLLAAGIRPDFQMELENLNVMRVMSYAAERFDLSGICLVASSTVERKIKDFFDEVIYYFRPALSNFPIFSGNDDACPQNLDPTVTNVGLAFAQEVAFKEFYLFGIDMGQKGSNRHHATDSYHYSDVAKNDRKRTFEQEVPANFGGKAGTNYGLFWALDSFQRSIALTLDRGHKYFNCSDGALIKGATPRLSRTVDLPDPVEKRDQKVHDIIERFPRFEEEDFKERWQPDQMVDALNGVCDELIDIFAECDLVRGSDHLIASSRIFYGPPGDRFYNFGRLMLRGTVGLALVSVDYYTSRIKDGEKYDLANDIVRASLTRLINRMRVVAIEHIEMLDREEDADVAYLEGKLPIDLDKVPDLSKRRTDGAAPADLEATES